MAQAARTWWMVALVMATVMVSAMPAEAQRARRRNTPPPTPTQPDETKPADQASPEEEAQPGDPEDSSEPAMGDRPAAEETVEEVVLEPSPYLSRRNTKPWTFRAEVVVQSYQDGPRGPNDRRELDLRNLDFTSATVVFPVLASTASSETAMLEEDGRAFPEVDGEVRINDRAVPQDMALVDRSIDGSLLPSGTWRAQWLVADPNRRPFTGVRQMDLQLELHVECSETRFDERAASQIEWPGGEWPEDALAALQPEAYVEFDPTRGNRPYKTDSIDRTISQWMEGRDPKELKPVVLAKWIAGNLLETVQPSGSGLRGDRRTGLMTGFDLKPPPTTLDDGRGTGFDMTNLLVAMYRRAGLPARVVIGYDVGAAKDGRTFYDDKEGDPELRAWAEFCLYDEQNGTLGWIPVDVVAMRERSSRMPPRFLERPQEFFGNHDELEEIVPIAHHYTPAKTSTFSYEYPALWGWFVQPAAPVAGSQSIRFDANRTASRGRRR